MEGKTYKKMDSLANSCEKCNYLNMETLNNYVFDLLAQGRYFFTKQDALATLGINPTQFKYQAYRLSGKRVIKRIVNDFFMIISPEYRHLGSLPHHWIVNALMQHLNQCYYIGLLSAASMNGATEQQPMTLQVITDALTKPIHLERGSIEFHVYKYCSSAQLTTISTPSGYVKISTPAQTMVDLIRFYTVSGYLSNVASVIKNLAEECDAAALGIVSSREKTKPILQRLGYILEIVQAPALAQVVEHELTKRKLEYVPLRPDAERIGEKHRRWKLILNDTLELS